MPFDVEQTVLGSGVHLLALAGTMTMGGQLKQLEWKVEEIAKTKDAKVVLEMSNVSYLDSSAIGVLMGCSGVLKTAGGQLRIVAPTDRVKTIFKMTGIDSILLSSSTIAEAEQAFS